MNSHYSLLAFFFTWEKLLLLELCAAMMKSTFASSQPKPLSPRFGTFRIARYHLRDYKLYFLLQSGGESSTGTGWRTNARRSKPILFC